MRDLYAIFRRALKKPNGVLITHLVLPYPDKIDGDKEAGEDMKRQKMLFEHVLQFKVIGNLRSEQETKNLLTAVGFSQIETQPDPRGIRYTITARG